MDTKVEYSVKWPKSGLYSPFSKQVTRPVVVITLQNSQRQIPMEQLGRIIGKVGEGSYEEASQELAKTIQAASGGFVTVRVGSKLFWAQAKVGPGM